MIFHKKKTEKKETREERFRRIASRRVQDILEKLRLLGNCADRANYSYNEKQARKIFSTIEEELKIIRALFKKNKNKNKFILE